MSLSHAAPSLAVLTTSLVFAHLAAVVPLGAQDSTRSGGMRVSPGTLVRVRGRDLPLGPEPAKIVEQHSDTLVLRTRDGMIAIVPLDRVTDLEVAQGMRPRSDAVWQGARTGALVVGVPFALLTLYAVGYDIQHRHDPCSDVCIPFTPVVAASGAMLSGLAALVGAAVGAAVGPRRRWTRVPDSAMRVGIAPTRGGGGAVTLAFHF